MSRMIAATASARALSCPDGDTMLPIVINVSDVHGEAASSVSSAVRVVLSPSARSRGICANSGRARITPTTAASRNARVVMRRILIPHHRHSRPFPNWLSAPSGSLSKLRDMPTFGRHMLEHWMLDPDCTYLNHGTVVPTPRRVLQKQQVLRDEMERQPSRFVLRELGGYMPMPWRSASRLREASDHVAAFVGARPDDLVFVPNVTTGINAVLQSLELTPGDEI